MVFFKLMIQAICLVFYIVEYACLKCLFPLPQLLHATLLGLTPIFASDFSHRKQEYNKNDIRVRFCYCFHRTREYVIHICVCFVYCVVIFFRCFTQTSFNCGFVSTRKCPLFKLEEDKIWTHTQFIWLSSPDTWPPYELAEHQHYIRNGTNSEDM